MDAIEREMYLRMTLLWQTALIRIALPTLEDEVDVGLRYYKLSLLEQVPALNLILQRRPGNADKRRLPQQRHAQVHLALDGVHVTTAAIRTSTSAR